MGTHCCLPMVSLQSYEQAIIEILKQRYNQIFLLKNFMNPYLLAIALLISLILQQNPLDSCLYSPFLHIS